MKVLIIGPLPPPYTGNSRPFLNILDMFKRRSCDIEVINVSEIYSSGFIKKIFWWLKRIIVVLRRKDQLVYYSLAESTGGILRDFLMIHVLAFRKNTIYTHLLGGNNFSRKSKSKFRKFIISYISKCTGVIVEGETQAEVFYGLGQQNILVNRNYVDSINLDLDTKLKVWINKNKLKVLYLSNMLPGKGWLEVYKASKLLLDRDIQFLFAGNAEEWFVKKLNDSPNCEYLGFINGAEKQKIFTESHVFLMPTYYEFEGQPFSIIEAMSYGCIIGTTYHSGIVDVFTDGYNGKRILKHDSINLAKWLTDILTDSSNVEFFISNNIEQVKSKHMYNTWLKKIENFIF